jgi:hypothetical protein
MTSSFPPHVIKVLLFYEGVRSFMLSTNVIGTSKCQIRDFKLPLEGKMYAFSDDMKETDFKKRKFVS